MLFVLFWYQAKLKAERSRQKTLETLQKAAHSQRTEAAQNRREEKRRAEKERMMNEDDPEKQRKLEVHFNSLLIIYALSGFAAVKVHFLIIYKCLKCQTACKFVVHSYLFLSRIQDKLFR